MPPGRAARPDAASSVAPIANCYRHSLRPCLGTTIASRRRAAFRQTLLDSQAMKAPPYTAASVEVVRHPGGEAERDEVAVEEPLEIRVNGRAIAVTMRTPGHDEELALGFLLSEGFTPLRADVPADLPANTVDVQGEVDLGRLQRNFYTS